MATASSPALAAPDGPMATVATGMPFGICAVESSESRPLSALCIGTPITGAPSAPRRRRRDARRRRAGDDHLHAAARGARRVFGGHRRRPVCRQHATFVRDPEFGQDVAGLPHRVPIRFAAHQNADEWLSFSHGRLFHHSLRVFVPSWLKLLHERPSPHFYLWPVRRAHTRSNRHRHRRRSRSPTRSSRCRTGCA